MSSTECRVPVMFSAAHAEAALGPCLLSPPSLDTSGAHDLRTKGQHERAAAAAACLAWYLQHVVHLQLAGCGSFKAEDTTAKSAQREIGTSHALEEG